MERNDPPKSGRRPQGPSRRRTGGETRPGSQAPARRGGRPDKLPGLWLWGSHAVLAALNNPARTCHQLLATKDALESLGGQLERKGLAIQIAEKHRLDHQCGQGAVHQGLALQVAPLPQLSLERMAAVVKSPKLFIVLDQITDAHNIGAILRSAAAFDASAVIVPKDNTPEMGGAVAKAASGALERMPVITVTNVARALEHLKERNCWVVGLDGAAEQPLSSLPDVRDRVLVLGSEGKGLRRLVAEHCDLLLRLPISGKVESLNVSVAAGIALYALASASPGS